jgi:raffinose/stachyose/melibiose transport system permease protein
MSRKKKIKISSVMVTLMLLLFLLIGSYPVILSVITSLKTDTEVIMDPTGMPSSFQLKAFVRAWNIIGFSSLLKNSIYYSVFGTFLAVVFSIFPAYALGRFKFPYSNLVFLIILTGMMIPQQSVVIPLYEVLRRLKLLNKPIGLIVVHGVYGIPFIILVLRGFIVNIPKELEDAARVDGYGDTGILLKIMIPLLVPSIAVASVLNIINIWKELFFSLIFLKDDVFYPLTVGLLKVTQGQFFNSWNLPAAAVLMAMLPTLVIYVFGYQLIQKGTVSGAVKG